MRTPPRAGQFFDVRDVTGITDRWWLPAEYTLRGVLGRGSFGVVIEVVDSAGTAMAAKRVQLLAPPRSKSRNLSSAAAQLLRRTLREICVLRRLQRLRHHGLRMLM